MAFRLRHLIRLAAFAALFPAAVATLPGQTGDGKAPPPAFTVCALDDSPLWTQLYYLPAPPKPPVKLGALGNRRSAPVKITGNALPLVFGVERVDPETQKPIYVPVVEVAWPGDARNALVILVPGTTQTSPRALAIDDGQKAFPLRSVRVFNATGATFLARIAEFQGELPPGVSPAHPYKIASETDLTQVGAFPLALAVNDSQRAPRVVYNSYADAWPLGRSLLHILPPAPGSDTLRIGALVDAPLPETQR
ncbi:MAG: hypothetical protein WC205_02580 [Opitutaceae bacterium]|jgi:hypothetical protein